MDARKINGALLQVFLRFRKGQRETAPQLTRKGRIYLLFYTAILTVFCRPGL
ncbi:hypothetical protein EDF68_106121 [Ochrobactrum sp. BH3]|nr:hypothetical protein EDF68_106121 [Ochrobactrum sp. BH3]